MAKRSEMSDLAAAMAELRAPPCPPGFKTISELANELGMSDTTIRSMISRLGSRLESRKASCRNKYGRVIQTTVYKIKPSK